MSIQAVIARCSETLIDRADLSTSTLSHDLLDLFGIQLHHATLGNAFIEFAKALRSIPDLEPEVRECAILGVGYRMQAAYEE